MNATRENELTKKYTAADSIEEAQAMGHTFTLKTRKNRDGGLDGRCRRYNREIIELVAIFRAYGIAVWEG